MNRRARPRRGSVSPRISLSPNEEKIEHVARTHSNRYYYIVYYIIYYCYYYTYLIVQMCNINIYNTIFDRIIICILLYTKTTQPYCEYDYNNIQRTRAGAVHRRCIYKRIPYCYNITLTAVHLIACLIPYGTATPSSINLRALVCVCVCTTMTEIIIHKQLLFSAVAATDRLTRRPAATTRLIRYNIIYIVIFFYYYYILLKCTITHFECTIYTKTTTTDTASAVVLHSSGVQD